MKNPILFGDYFCYVFVHVIVPEIPVYRVGIAGYKKDNIFVLIIVIDVVVVK